MILHHFPLLLGIVDLDLPGALVSPIEEELGRLLADPRLVAELDEVRARISDKVAAENKCPAWMRVSEVMTTHPITVPPATYLDECVRLMEKHGIYHLPVVDESETYRGMISVQDLLRVIASDEKARADMLESFLFSGR